jgi:hypothetical protein
MSIERVGNFPYTGVKYNDQVVVAMTSENNAVISVDQGNIKLPDLLKFAEYLRETARMLETNYMADLYKLDLTVPEKLQIQEALKETSASDVLKSIQKNSILDPYLEKFLTDRIDDQKKI